MLIEYIKHEVIECKVMLFSLAHFIEHLVCISPNMRCNNKIISNSSTISTVRQKKTILTEEFKDQRDKILQNNTYRVPTDTRLTDGILVL